MASFCGTRAAQRSRWKPARGVCSQHSQLPPLSEAESSVNGRAALPRSRVRSAWSCVPSSLVRPLCVFRDWSRRLHRRECIQLLRHQRVEVQMEFDSSARPTISPAPLSRAQRAHYRLDFQERFARNARAPTASQVTIRLFGGTFAFAAFLGRSPA